MTTLPIRKTSQFVIVALLVLIPVSSILFGDVARAETLVDITLDRNKALGTNSFSVGFSMDHVMNNDERDFLQSSTVKQLALDAGFKLVRIVDFRNTLQPCTQWYESSKTGTFNWGTMDTLVQRIFEIGAEPLLSLGSFTGYGSKPIVPRGMAINPSTGLPYPESFAAYCSEWAKHFKSKGMPVRFYEIMNEAWFYFWSGWGQTNSVKLANYVTLLNTIYDRVQAVDSNIMIGTDSSTIRSFLDYFVKNGRGLGFLSFHKYDSGSTSDSDSRIFTSAEQSRFETTSTFYGPDKARQTYYDYKRVYIPVVNSETNLSWLWESGTDPRIQKMSGAIWTALMIRSCITKSVSYSIYYRLLSSRSTESRKSTGGSGFGLINSDNDQPWYPYYVNKMIGNNLQVGNPILSSGSSSAEIRTLAWLNGDKLNLLLICKVSYERTIRLQGISGQLDYFKIDNSVSWLTPRLQTGSLNSADTFILNGYTVMLLQQTASSPPPPPPQSTIFADGFESGDFREETGTITTSGETATISTYSPYLGECHARFYSSGNGVDERAYCYKDIGPTSEIYARAYINIRNTIPFDSENDRFNMIALEGEGGQILASVTLQRISGVNQLGIRTLAGAWFSSLSLSTNQWYCIELYAKVDSAEGAFKLWVDGNKLIEETGLYTTAEGNVSSIRFGLTYINSVTKSVLIYCDNVEASGSYIGPEV